MRRMKDQEGEAHKEKEKKDRKKKPSEAKPTKDGRSERVGNEGEPVNKSNK